jgi:hypothetical protein
LAGGLGTPSVVECRVGCGWIRGILIKKIVGALAALFSTDGSRAQTHKRQPPPTVDRLYFSPSTVSTSFNPSRFAISHRSTVGVAASNTGLRRGSIDKILLEKYVVCHGLFHGFDWSAVGQRLGSSQARAAAKRSGAHPETSGRKESAIEGRHRLVESPCSCCSARRSKNTTETQPQEAVKIEAATRTKAKKGIENTVVFSDFMCFVRWESQPELECKETGKDWRRPTPFRLSG